MLDKRKFYINGKWTEPISKNDLNVTNPSLEKDFAVIALGNEEDVDKAVNIAKKAFQSWKSVEKNINRRDD